jgi:hypothetical protein
MSDVAPTRPPMTALERLKLCLKVAPTREAATRLFDEFIAGGASDAKREMASVYLGWTFYELDEARL